MTYPDKFDCPRKECNGTVETTDRIHWQCDTCNFGITIVPDNSTCPVCGGRLYELYDELHCDTCEYVSMGG